MRASRSKIYIIIGIFLALIITLHYLNYLRNIEAGIRYIVKPISFRFNNWRIGLSNNFTDAEDLKKDHEMYISKMQEFDTVVTKNYALEIENNELKQQLNFYTNKKFGKVTTNVVGKNTDSLQKMIIIDAGESAGIKNGQPVITGDGILVGIVAKVEKDISVVRLLNDNQSKIAATVLNKDRSLGVVEGGYGLSVKMNFIPRNETILIGDKIMSSGLEQNIPRGLLIGEVAVAQNESYQPFQQAILTTSADLSKLTVVSVLTSL